MKVYTVFNKAPRYLSQRYGALNSLVWETLFPQEYKNKLLRKIKSEEKRTAVIQKMKDIADEATTVLFIFVTKKLFIEGSNAAKNAVDILKELGVTQFKLGNSIFSERNENVVLGDVLAEKLLQSLNKSSSIG